jgi:hypothetical protein
MMHDGGQTMVGGTLIILPQQFSDPYLSSPFGEPDYYGC